MDPHDHRARVEARETSARRRAEEARRRAQEARQAARQTHDPLTAAARAHEAEVHDDAARLHAAAADVQDGHAEMARALE